MLCEHCSTIYVHENRQRTTLRELLHAVKNGCYICLDVLDGIQAGQLVDLDRYDHDAFLLLRTSRGSIISSYEMAIGLLGDFAVWGADTDLDHCQKIWGFYTIRVGRKYGLPKHHENAISAAGACSDWIVLQRYTPTATTTNSPEVASLARTWYQQCCRNHDACNVPRESAIFAARDTTLHGMPADATNQGQPKRYPPRLIDVSSDLVPRLITAQQVHNGAAYAALSHCWGKIPFLTLTTNKLAVFQEDGIDLALMPENFCNVIQICRWLNIRYLWIDSLCILQSGQGSEEDWRRHLVLMPRIYADCDLCISTAAAESAVQSCFRQRNLASITRATLLFDGQPHLIISDDFTNRGARSAPIALRAWTLQERLLSRRVLTFGHSQIYWECEEFAGQNVSETFPDGLSVDTTDFGPFSLPSSLPTEPSDLQTYPIWVSLIETYTRCTLTESHKDKLVAFAGIATHMQEVFRQSPYLAGFFLFELPSSLLWFNIGEVPQSKPTPPTGFFRSPSWSWAATDMPVACYTTSWHVPALKIFSTISDYKIELVDPDSPCGQLLYAELTLRGPLIPLTWSLDKKTSSYRYSMPRIDFDYEYRDDMFFFDSLDNSSPGQDDVYFLPIMSHFERAAVGIVLSAVRLPKRITATYDAGPGATARDDLETYYERTGRATVEGEVYLDRIDSIEPQDVVLI